MQRFKFFGIVPNDKADEFVNRVEDLFGFELASELNLTEGDWRTKISVDCDNEEEVRHLDLLVEQLND
jgi:hypothetical protein